MQNRAAQFCRMWEVEPNMNNNGPFCLLLVSGGTCNLQVTTPDELPLSSTDTPNMIKLQSHCQSSDNFAP
jgi:hypothetical protein